MGEFHTLSCCDHVVVTWQEALFWVVPLNRSPEVCVRSTWGHLWGHSLVNVGRTPKTGDILAPRLQVESAGRFTLPLPDCSVER